MAATPPDTDPVVPDPATDRAHDPASEVVTLCRELIRIDTSNYGDEEGPGERKAAEYVATLLDEVGIGARQERGERVPAEPRSPAFQAPRVVSAPPGRGGW